MMIRVLLVEDHLVLAQSLASLLGREDAIEVVGIASTASSAIESATAQKPDVIVMDLRLPDGSGAEAAVAIRAIRPETAFLFLSGDESEEALLEAIDAGGAAFLEKSAPVSNLVEAVVRVAGGESLIRLEQFQRALQERTAQRRYDRDRRAALAVVTAREREILELLSNGEEVAAIARSLHVSPLTVRTHVKSILAKLGVHSQLQAVARARALGIL